ncbi:MAG: hypothetical protein HC836_24705 [Richelia sp. RM2_1_2]|nr:hypothetical protein [Richelia sp. RM1_1_1]NJO61336.1 hypothetical protein [Richelia sp. RM2_1_2]
MKIPKYQHFRNSLLDVGIKPTNLMFGGLILTALIVSIPSLKKHQAKIDLIRTEIKHREDVAEKLERQLSYEQRQAQVANKRYESCLPVVGDEYHNGTHYFTGIKEGDKPKDKITRKNLPTGTIVCDAHGNTGVVNRDGAVSYLAFTGDRDVVQKRLSRFRGSQYSQPVLGN